jgi:hypothetical protein
MLEETWRNSIRGASRDQPEGHRMFHSQTIGDGGDRLALLIDNPADRIMSHSPGPMRRGRSKTPPRSCAMSKLTDELRQVIVLKMKTEKKTRNQVIGSMKKAFTNSAKDFDRRVGVEKKLYAGRIDTNAARSIEYLQRLGDMERRVVAELEKIGQSTWLTG